MRILFVARRLDVGETSGGLGSTKLLHALADAGHEVVAIAAEVSPLLDHQGRALEVHELTERPARPTSPWAKRVDFARLLALGVSDAERRRVRALAGEIRRVSARSPFDVVFTRGIGQDQTPAMAAIHAGLDTPVVTNWHDPWPSTATPEPYRRGASARRQVARRDLARRLLRRSALATFPSERLARWELGQLGLGGDDVRIGVIPHIGDAGRLDGTAPATASDEIVDSIVRQAAGRPILAHVGFLNRQRNARSLLAAYRRRVARGEPVPFLVLAGSVDDKLAADPVFAGACDELAEAGCLFRHFERMTYGQSSDILARADVALVISEGIPESPYFPGKLADALAMGKPVATMCPPRSVPCDLLGRDHALWAPLDDEQAAEVLVERVAARRWVPVPDDLRRSVTSTAVAARAGELLESVLRRPAS